MERHGASKGDNLVRPPQSNTNQFGIISKNESQIITAAMRQAAKHAMMPAQAFDFVDKGKIFQNLTPLGVSQERDPGAWPSLADCAKRRGAEQGIADTGYDNRQNTLGIPGS